VEPPRFRAALTAALPNHVGSRARTHRKLSETMIAEREQMVSHLTSHSLASETCPGILGHTRSRQHYPHRPETLGSRPRMTCERCKSSAPIPPL